MSPATIAHDAAATKVCREPGCPDDARYDRGVAAGYCERHGKPLMQAHGRSTAATRVPAPPGTLAAATQSLATAARRVEAARRRFDTAKASVANAVAEYRAACAEVDRVTADVLRGSTTDPEGGAA